MPLPSHLHGGRLGVLDDIDLEGLLHDLHVFRGTQQSGQARRKGMAATEIHAARMEHRHSLHD